jgi:hypothetical protein
MKQKIWFFDLEETIITDFRCPTIINLEVVKNFLEFNNIKEVGIFSAAIWTEREKKIFNQPNFKDWLESVFGFKIVLAPSMQDVMDEILWKTGTLWDLSEFIAVWGKARAFQDYCRLVHPNKNSFLIDDVVPNEVILNRDFRTTIELINIDVLEKWKLFEFFS